jgi:hypothetical protein
MVGDPVENEANRRQAAIEAARAMAGLNRLRDQKLGRNTKLKTPAQTVGCP